MTQATHLHDLLATLRTQRRRRLLLEAVVILVVASVAAIVVGLLVTSVADDAACAASRGGRGDACLGSSLAPFGLYDGGTTRSSAPAL